MDGSGNSAPPPNSPILRFTKFLLRCLASARWSLNPSSLSYSRPAISLFRAIFTGPRSTSL